MYGETPEQTKPEPERDRCASCLETKDACQLDDCYGCGKPICEWCGLELEGYCEACARVEG